MRECLFYDLNLNHLTRNSLYDSIQFPTNNIRKESVICNTNWWRYNTIGTQYDENVTNLLFFGCIWILIYITILSYVANI